MFRIDTFFLSISTFLLCIHIIYGGYYILKKENKINFILALLCGTIGLCLISLVVNIPQPLFWIISLQSALFLAIFFHSLYKKRLSTIYLKEYCNYKIHIDIYGIVLGFLGLLFLTFFPSQTTVFSIISIYFILRLNFLILIKKKAYKMYYPDILLPLNPLVSIVIIAYNEEKYIGELLRSIKKQDYNNFEVIVVDDHSEDKTIEVAENFKSSFPLKIVQKEVRGVSRSRNYGASQARGEIILFLDADVVLPYNFISKNLKSFIQQKLSIATIDFIPATDRIIDKFIIMLYRIWLKTVQYYKPRGPGFCLLVLRELHNKVLFDESIIMCEDFDYTERASNLGKFRILKEEMLKVSWRRFEKENDFILIVKYLFFELYRQNIGKIRRESPSYKFGRFH